mmetsp:Transcript_21563/g.36741  ORF Transcript_21563/g.36741 Transcript_21563/m.36741 type:complete len:108 (-) Transcript_21563:216-539(-)
MMNKKKEKRKQEETTVLELRSWHHPSLSSRVLLYEKVGSIMFGWPLVAKKYIRNQPTSYPVECGLTNRRVLQQHTIAATVAEKVRVVSILVQWPLPPTTTMCRFLLL